MARQGMAPLVISVRRPDDPPELATEPVAEVLYLPEEKVLRSEVDARRSSLPRRVRHALSRHRPEPDSQRLFEAVWLAPMLRQRGIRHVHAHFGGLAARTAWWLRKLHGIPYSFTGHANDIFCETEFPVTNGELVRGAEFVVTETDFARRWMEEKYPRARGRVFRVFNGIDTTGFPERQASAAPPRILSVGRYVEKKGFRDLIAACAILRREGLDFRCEIIGGGPLEAQLRAQIEQEQLGGCVHLLGPRAQPEVRAHLAAASAFVLACVPEAGGGSDNLPTVIMEAMSAGVPVISTRLAGVPEMITHGADGLLTAPSKPAELALAIRELLSAPALAAALGQAGRVTARDKFAVGQTTGALKRLLIERAGVQPPAAALALEPTLLGPPGFLQRVWRRLLW
jgi:glycosyltransferase involved in cell wall biosynthesis